MSHHIDPNKRRTPPEKVLCERTGKVTFKRHQDAMKVIGMQRPRKAAISQWPKSTYRCEHCGRWHISSYTPEASRRIQHAKKRQQNQRKRGPKP